MDAWDDPRVSEIVGMFASQTAKTEAVNNIIGCRITNYPGPMMLLQPTLEMAKAWSKDRLSPMLRDTPCLRGKVRDARSRDSGNTVLHKKTPGGHLTIVGANSAAGLSMRPIRDVFCDEPDRYPASAGTEGDPVRLAVTRTRAFFDAKKAYIGSPTIAGVSRIEKLWNRSDQRRYFVPCHACGHEQTLKWSQVQWDKDPETGDLQPWTARYVCESCGAHWSDAQRRAAVRKGRWIAGRPLRGCAGFHINALAAPWASCDLEHLVSQWMEAQGNPALLQVFINTVLAELWDDSQTTKTIDETGLMDRREALPKRGGLPMIPAQVAIVTAGVDIQDNRFEATLWAWAGKLESWVLEHAKLFGDPSNPALWEDLERWLMRPLPRARGGFDFIRGACIDTGGHHSQAAYDFCGPRFRRITPDGGRQFIFAIRGAAGAGEVWPRAHSKVTTKVPLWTIRVDPAKEHVYGRLSITDPGAGYVHFSDSLEPEFFKGLTAEQVVTEVHRKSGRPQRRWKLKGPGLRNEPLDCAAYAYAALCGLHANGFDLEAEAERLANRTGWNPPAPVAAEQPVPPQVTPGRPKPPPAANEWLGDTRGWLR